MRSRHLRVPVEPLSRRCAPLVVAVASPGGPPANVFLPGHHIRLEVSRSTFPRFNRNRNTGRALTSEAASDYRHASKRVFHDAAHPPRLILPIIKR